MICNKISTFNDVQQISHLMCRKNQSSQQLILKFYWELVEAEMKGFMMVSYAHAVENKLLSMYQKVQTAIYIRVPPKKNKILTFYGLNPT